MKLFKKYRYSLFILLLILTATLAITQIAKNIQNSSTQISSNEAADKEVATGEDPWAEIEKVVNAYYHKDGILYEGTMKLIDGSQAEERTIEETKFSYSISGNDFHYRLGAMEVVNKKDLLLAIDHDTKTMLLSLKPTLKENHQLFDLATFKRLLEERKADAKVSQTNSGKIITIDNIEDPAVQGYRIYYNPATYQIYKMELGMQRYSPVEELTGPAGENKSDESDKIPLNEDQETEENTDLGSYTYYLEVSYSRIQPLASGTAFRPEEKFIKITRDTIQLTDEFKGYTISGADQ